MNKETGDRIAMDEMANRSTANPAMRRREMMTLMRGFEDIANETGCVGDFYTITAPLRYHSVYSKGGFITKWNGSSPRDTQRYLCRVWARIRAALSREVIHLFGFRAVEPHHDGKPHWHMLLFMLPEHRERVQQGMREHASSKNIDGFAMDGKKDDETGSNKRDMAKAVCAWASCWRIRQFQQIGGAPVTVWRELRRLGDTRLANEKMDAVLASASVASCWASYTMAQGGPLVARDDLVIRLCYESTEMGNEYAEDVQRVQGIYSPHYK